MRYVLTCEATIRATPEETYAVWSDFAAYPSWDDREEANNPEGPLALGLRGTYRQRGGREGTYVVSAFEPGRSWTTEEKVPGGRLETEHDISPAGAGATRVTRRYVVEGLAAIPFRIIVARGIRREMRGSFAALEGEVARRRDAG